MREIGYRYQLHYKKKSMIFIAGIIVSRLIGSAVTSAFNERENCKWISEYMLCQ